MDNVLEVVGIEKKYPGVIANRDVSLNVKAGSIHAIIGENGAGKSTLMKILYGLIRPDSGKIKAFGKDVTLKSPQDAIALGIGMVHQHFKLADNATVLENVILGSEPTRMGFIINFDQARKKLVEIAEHYGLEIDPDESLSNLGVGERQRVEIAKVLFRGAKILILDEPTAVLVPQEVEELFSNLRELVKRGLTVLFISHKLDEVLSIADEITIMRQGTTVASRTPKSTNKVELAELMVGGELPKPRAGLKKSSSERLLSITGASYVRQDGREVLSNVNLELNAGEILGLAGVEGNGQSELIELIMGLIKPSVGSVEILGLDATKSLTKDIRNAGVAYIPQDRQRDGLLMSAPLWENRVLGHQFASPMANNIWVNKGEAIKDSKRVVTEFDVRTPGINVLASALSGGNQQKFIVGRELSGNPRVIVAAQPTRGVDVGAQAIIWNQLMKARTEGAGILLISADLDELFSLSDRIAVIYNGSIVSTLDPNKTTPEELGLAMTGAKSA
ncbi:MAG: ABC transporter ATP-binding protein [Actinobacteria bacterium]|nr:ABC transporter ATP-binding protein [Actinomycetota bacterium]